MQRDPQIAQTYVIAGCVLLIKAARFLNQLTAPSFDQGSDTPDGPKEAEGVLYL